MRLIQHQQQQHHHTKAGASSTSTLSWKSSTRSWHIINISTKLEIFSTKLASYQHRHEAGNLQYKAGISTTSARSWKSSARGWHLNNISTKLEIFNTRLTSQQHQHKAGNLPHEADISTTSTLKLEIFNTRLASTLLPLSREVLSDYTKLVSKVLKLDTRQRLGQHINKLFIRANIMELYGSSLHHITNEMIPDLYVLRLIMEHIIFIQLWLSHRITVASISRSNRSVNNIRSHMDSPLAEHVAIYSAYVLLRAILDCFLLCHEVMTDPRLNQHHEVLFISETLPVQSETIYPYNLNS
jgi:hypothetical protein